MAFGKIVQYGDASETFGHFKPMVYATAADMTFDAFAMYPDMQRGNAGSSDVARVAGLIRDGRLTPVLSAEVS